MDYEVRTIGDGWAGTATTVETIYELVDQAILDPVVVRKAREIVIHVPERDQAAESRAISAWVRSRLRYTKESVETLTTPREVLDWVAKYGKFPEDCDGATLVWLALHKAIGIPVRATVVSQRADRKGSHIFGQVLLKGRGWVTDDTIVRAKPYGWAIPMRQRTKTKSYDMDGLGDEVDQEEELGMTSMKFTRHGAIKKIRSDLFTPRRRRMIGPSVASRGYRMKPTGMIYVDRAGRLSGVGANPELGIDFSSILSTAIDAGGKVASAVKSSRAKPAPAPAPAQRMQKNDEGGSAGGTTMLLLLGLLGFLAFGRR